MEPSRHRLRFTISGILAIVVFIAVTAAALRESTEAWDSGVFSLLVLMLLGAVLLAVHREGPIRAYWLGFSLFGWLYLAASLIPSIETRLPTTKGLVTLDSMVPGRSEPTFSFVVNNQTPGTVAFLDTGSTVSTTQGGSVRISNAATGKLLAGQVGTSENFVRIGHSLLALVLGGLGGLYSRWIAMRNEG